MKKPSGMQRSSPPNSKPSGGIGTRSFSNSLPRRLAILTLGSALSLSLASCVTTPSPATLRLDPPPPSLVQACARPVALPERALTAAEVESLWARDAAALIQCGLEKAALISFYRDRDSRLDPTE